MFFKYVKHVFFSLFLLDLGIYPPLRGAQNYKRGVLIFFFFLGAPSGHMGYLFRTTSFPSFFFSLLVVFLCCVNSLLFYIRFSSISRGIMSQQLCSLL